MIEYSAGRGDKPHAGIPRNLGASGHRGDDGQPCEDCGKTFPCPTELAKRDQLVSKTGGITRRYEQR